jgi:hypothetical protein
MVATMIPIYPLALHEEGDWTPAPEMYFTREFILRIIERTIDHEPDFGWRLHPKNPIYLVYDDPPADSDEALLPPRKPKGHLVYEIDPTSWTTDLGSGEEIVKGGWPD